VQLLSRSLFVPCFVLQLTGSMVLDVSGGVFYVRTEEVRTIMFCEEPA